LLISATFYKLKVGQNLGQQVPQHDADNVYTSEKERHMRLKKKPFDKWIILRNTYIYIYILHNTYILESADDNVYFKKAKMSAI
jgi:hypothetical protein